MAHVRKQIRDAVITALTGLSTTGSNVFRSRIYPLESNKIPGLCVFSKSEATTFDTLTRPRSINLFAIRSSKSCSSPICIFPCVPV